MCGLWCNGFAHGSVKAEVAGSTPPKPPVVQSTREWTTYREVLLGEQAVSKTAAQGSNPCFSASCVGPLVGHLLREQDQESSILSRATPLPAWLDLRKAPVS